MDLYRQLYRRLSGVYAGREAEAVARRVMEDAFGLSLTDLLMDKDNALSANDRLRLANITERLVAGCPVQYAVGTTLWCGHRFEVGEGVLIPRPETEQLLSLIEEHDGPLLDVGTGSGCIAISAALAHPTWAVEAWDISAAALRIARRNAERLGARVAFRQCDALTTLPPAAAYGLIVSNPPYICEREAREMETNVLRYEPREALFVPDADPLLFYRAIARMGLTGLEAGGALLFEANTSYARDVALMLDEMGYSCTRVVEDIYGRERFVTAQKN